MQRENFPSNVLEIILRLLNSVLKYVKELRGKLH